MNSKRLLLFALILIAPCEVDAQRWRNFLDMLSGYDFSKTEKYYLEAWQKDLSRLRSDSVAYVNSVRSYEGQIASLNETVVNCNVQVEVLQQDIEKHLDKIRLNERELGKLTEQLRNCNEKLDTCDNRLIRTKGALAIEEMIRDSLDRALHDTQDTLKNVRQQLSNTQAECATESFRIVGHYKSWGRKYQVTLNRPAGESTNPHPRKLSKVTVEFNTCNADYSAVVKCTLGNKVVNGENINDGKYKGEINKLKNKGKNWYQKGKSYQFVITESSHGEDEMEVLNKHLQNNASIRF